MHRCSDFAQLIDKFFAQSCVYISVTKYWCHLFITGRKIWRFSGVLRRRFQQTTAADYKCDIWVIEKIADFSSENRVFIN